MPRTRKQLENEAQSLPREERAWLAEAERRAAELDSGAVKSVPAEDVFSELDSLANE